MTDVTRYYIHGPNYEIDADPRGDWVEAADYDAATRWVPVTERRPPASSHVLVWGPGFGGAAIDFYGPLHSPDDWFQFAEHEGKVTHWRAIPDPPSQ